MKKILLIALIMIPLSIFSQSFQENAPWMKSSLKKKGVTTLNDITIAAEKYFNTIDRFKKGSGLKPFERWKYNASFYLNDDGTIAPSEKLWNAWRQKNQLKAAKTSVDNSDWESVGPNSSSNTYSSSTLKSSGQGRINTIAVDPNNSNTYYAGAPAGGIWKSIDAGINWQPLTDYLPQIGVSGIAISPSDSNVIYIATGDDDANDSYSVGVMKSTDGGATWNATGTIAGNPNSMNEIYIDPNNTDTILVATSNGVFKTTDGGTNWVQKLDKNVLDLKMKPGDATTWYAVSSSKFYKSTDSGESFAEVVIPTLTGSTRLTIDVTIADPTYVYMVSAGGGSAFNGVFKSTDSGTSFTKTSEISDIFKSTQAWFDLAITVSSNNVNIVYVGVLDIWKSTDGGNSFTKLTEWFSPDQPNFSHADIHFLRFIDGKFFAGTDGGVYRSTDEGVNFTDLTKTMGISQFYKISVSPQNSNNIVGGIQDNGGMAINENTWRNWHGGDGMEGQAHPTEPNTHYGFSQYGGVLNKTTTGGKSNQGITGPPAGESGGTDSGGEWVTPMVINSAGVVYSGFKKLYKLVGSSWTVVSSASLRVFDDIDHIEIDPNEDNNIYLTEKAELFRSTDGGVNFTKIPFTGSTINGIEISNLDSNIAWVVTGPKVFKSVNILDASPTFTDITGNLPSETKLVVKHHARSGNNTIYLGTTLGVYYINDDLTTWEVFENKLPNVQVRDLDINEEDAKLYAGTYGRGVFVTDIPKVLPMNDVRLLSIQEPTNSINCSSGISPKIIVKNQGTAVISSITVNYSFDGQASSSYTWNGTLNSEASTTIVIPTSNLSKGNHTMRVETTITNDTYSQNNVQSSTFAINEFNATPTTINTFEADADNLLIETNTGTDLWQRGVPNKTLLNTVGSGTSAYVTGLSGNYPDGTTSYLYTNCYDLSTVSNPILKFKMAFDIEQDWDHMYVQYSTDLGATWTILGSATDANWYNSSSTLNGLPGKQWTGEGEDTNILGGNNAVLHEYSYDLAAFTNESSMIFRFKFVADTAVNEEGVLIDDLLIDGVLPVSEVSAIKGLSIYPNPSSSIFEINWQEGATFSVKVYDVTGKLVLEQKGTREFNNHFELNMATYVKGLYFAKITVDEKQVTKKIILK